MSQRLNDKEPNLVKKLTKLKEKQDNWMKERESAKSYTSKSYIHSSLKSSDSAKKTKTKQNQQDVKKKDDALVWTSNSNYKGFVVRNGSGSARSKQNSARDGQTPKKTFTHSSLKKQEQSSNNMTGRSANIKSNSGISVFKTNGVEKSSAEEFDSQSDESLSTSFTDRISSINFNELTPDSLKTISSKSKSKLRNPNDFMANHYCKLCNQVMVTEDRKPQMVFPCGHSFCRNCINNKEICPDCNCDIISTQSNESLYAIIQQFKQKTDREELERKEKQIRKYLEEYRNLNTRIGIMKGEATNIIDEMEDITHKLIDKQNKIRNTEQNIEELENEIASLKQLVQQHNQDIELESDNVKSLEKSYGNQKGQLNMLQKTISSLTENKEKLSRLVQDLSPNMVSMLNDMDDED